MKSSKGNKWKIAFLVISLIIIAIFIWCTYQKYYGLVNCIYANSDYEVKLLPPLKEKTIYRFEFGEGEDFSVFYYDKASIKKIINNNDFEEITEDNIENVNKILKGYQDDLCDKERKLFDKITTISKLSNVGNYYRYLAISDKKYFVFIIFPDSNELYYLYISH